MHGAFNGQFYGIWRILFPSVYPLLGGVTGLVAQCDLICDAEGWDYLVCLTGKGSPLLIELDQLESQHAHNLLASAIVPRPIAWVSTVNPAGEHNLAPFSFFTGITWRPATIGISIVNRKDGTEKDTLRNIRQIREFVVNSVSVAQGGLMFECAQTLPYGTDEASQLAVEMIPSTRVKPRRVKAAKVSFECSLLDVVTVGD